MIINLTSARLTKLFEEVYSSLIIQPTNIYEVTDDTWHSNANKVLGLAYPATSEKAGIYLNAKLLLRESDEAIRHVIAHELAHVKLGHAHAAYGESEVTDKVIETCADLLAGTWGYPYIPIYKQ